MVKHSSNVKGYSGLLGSLKKIDIEITRNFKKSAPMEIYAFEPFAVLFDEFIKKYDELRMYEIACELLKSLDEFEKKYGRTSELLKIQSVFEKFKKNYELLREIKKSNAELKKTYDTTIEGWGKALELRDSETEGHSHGVMDFAVKLAKEMGLNDEEIQIISRGALLHDIGKIGIPNAILLKQDALTEDEQKIMNQHPTFGYEMLKEISYLQPAAAAVYSHHERWDGKGYPQSLKGEKIPLSARIVAVANHWDAHLHDRPNQKAWTREKVIKDLQEKSGKMFDPEIVKVFLGKVIDNEG